MHYFRLFLLAAAAHAASWHGKIEERDVLLTGDVQLGDLPAPIEPWPGYFEGKGPNEAQSSKARSLESRSPSSANLCRDQPGSPHGQGWLLKQAVCERQDANGLTFWSDCVGKADPTVSIKQAQGFCGHGHRCFEFHGMNEQSEPAYDITCVDSRSVREWFIDSTASHDYYKCSPKYINHIPGNNALNISLQVNVLDTAKLNRIGVKDIYFWLDSRVKVGVERSDDSTVGSGIFTLYRGQWVQACVRVSPGQIIWAAAAMTAKTILYCSAGLCHGAIDPP